MNPGSKDLGPRNLFRLALSDAAVSPADVELYLSDLDPEPGAPDATTVHPGDTAFDLCAEHFPFFAEDRDRSRLARDKHEILAYSGAAPYVLVAVLRHELEHVRQHSFGDELLVGAGLLAEAVKTHLGERSPAFRALYAAFATERAADAAGRVLAQSLFGPPPSDLLGGAHETLLFVEEAPPAHDELKWRLIADLMLFPSWVAEKAESHYHLPWREAGRTVAALAEILFPGSGLRLAVALNEDDAVTEIKAQVRAGIPTADRGTGTAARIELRPLVIAVETRARELLESIGSQEGQ